MNENEFLEMMKTLLGNDALQMDMELEQIASWDSLSRIVFITQLEKMDIVVPRFEVAEAESLEDLFKIIKENE